jgi:hypothetical protein
MNGICSAKIRKELYVKLVGKSEGSKTGNVRINATLRRVHATVVAVEKQ